MNKSLCAGKRWVLLAPALAIGSLAHAGVLVVGAGGAYTQLQSAVGAAQDGDTILVRSGTYGGPTIDAKGLTICGDTGSAVMIQGTTTVRNLRATQTVVLANVSGVGTTPTSPTDSAGVGLYVHDDAGAVRVQACHFTGAYGAGAGTSSFDANGCCFQTGHAEGWAGARIESCAGGVEMSACTLLGGDATYPYYMCWCGTGVDGGEGLHVIGSKIALYESTATGGVGGQAGTVGGRGGVGLRMQSGTFTSGVFGSHTTFQGGLGGNGCDDQVSWGGDGGDGGNVGAGTIAQTLDCAFVPGPPGTSFHYDLGNPGNTLTCNGQLFDFPVTPVRLAVQAVVRESTSLTLTITAPPGDPIELYLSRRTVFEPLPSWRGVLLTNNSVPPRSMDLGTVPASGTLSFQLQVPDLGPGIGARPLFIQAFRRTPTNNITLGSFAAVTVLDSAY